MHAALAGIRVVEQGTFITGPCAGMMLADLGADVIKIESPEGDPYRAYQGGQYSPHFQAYNRNKRSLALDMKQAADCELFDRLVREADVYIQNFRPGTAERLGAGAARLQELNPRLVYCSISGFGSSGPYRDRPSYDSVAQALSGFLSVVVDYRRPQFLGSGAGRCHHRHVRRVGHPRRAGAARAHRAAAVTSRSRCSRRWRISPSSRSRPISRSARRRPPPTGRVWRRPTSCAPPTSA